MPTLMVFFNDAIGHCSKRRVTIFSLEAMQSSTVSLPSIYGPGPSLTKFFWPWLTPHTKFVQENVWEFFRHAEGAPTVTGKCDDITMTSRRLNPNFTFSQKRVVQKFVKPLGNGKYDPKVAYRSGLRHFWTTWRRRRPKKIFTILVRFLPSRISDWYLP